MALTEAEILALTREHGRAEQALELDNVMATLEATPVYYLYPVGLKMVGVDKVRRYYQNLFDNVMTRLGKSDVPAEWVSRAGVMQNPV